MPDQRFKFTHISLDAGSLCERLAVLRPVSRRGVRRSSTARAAGLDVLVKWRAACAGLAGAGWEPAAGPKCQFLRNCPPAGVSTAGGARLRPCHKAAVCPWCWSREVARRTFNAAVGFMASRGCLAGQDKAASYPYRLYVMTEDFEAGRGPRQPAAALADLLGAMTRTRAAMNSLSAGHARLSVVYPRRGVWVCSSRSLYLRPTTQAPAENETSVVDPTPANIAAAVARFARYPPALLRSPKQVRRMLDARAGRRLLRFGGGLYAAGEENSGEVSDNRGGPDPTR